MYLDFCQPEYISKTAKKKLFATDQTSALEKSLNLITAEALNIEDNILFNNNLSDEMKYRWIDYLMPFPSHRLDSTFPFPFFKNVDLSSNERFRQ